MPSSLTIRTDHKWRNLRYDSEVPKEVLERNFNYEYNTFGFFRYRGVWYNLDDFMVWQSGVHPFGKCWQAYLSDSYFSGILIEVSADGEQYRVGTYFC